MRIAVFGLGYVGTVSAACFARIGHEVMGVDVSKEKVEQINAGRSPIVEAEIDTLVAAAVANGSLHATQDAARAALWADVSLVCVGTPSRPNGSLDTSYVERVMCSIGAALADRETRHTVVVRSTLLPGTTLGRLKPLLEGAAGKRCGEEIGLAYNPEFLREGTAVRDFEAPPYTIVGGIDAESAQVAASVYASVDAPVHTVSIPEAEMIKYGANAFHALKITFANEIGNFSKAVGVDGHHVMKLLCEDTKLNISTAYLRPGFAYGGSCLPKDLRAILYAARQHDLDLPLLQSLPRSNAAQLERGVHLVVSQRKRDVGVLGFSFKAGTDDLRESPVVHLIETLIGKGFRIKIYDRNVKVARLTGANRQYIDSVVPHIAELMVDTVQEVLDHAETLVIGNNSPEFATVFEAPVPQAVIDLVRPRDISAEWLAAMDGRYHGVCW